VLSPPFRLDGAAASAGDFAPRLGEHTEAVIAELAGRDAAILEAASSPPIARRSQ